MMGIPIKSSLPVALIAATLIGCGSPTDLGFEVIEDIEFAASLDIDLSTFLRRDTGVYWKDVTVGGGQEVEFGTTPSISIVGWLKDGTQFLDGSETFLMGNSAVIGGLEDGILLQKVGGTRRLIVPPNRAYGGQGFTVDGERVVPPGAVVVFEVTVDSVATAQPSSQ